MKTIYLSLKASLLFLIILLFTNNKIHSQVLESITDTRDGKTCKTIQLGNQHWMAENLAFDTPNSKCYKNNTTNCQTFGKLYNWETANNVCPSGWHLPSKIEFDTLINYLGGNEIAGAKIKSNLLWSTSYPSNYQKVVSCNHSDEELEHDSIEINTSLFSALPGGGCYMGDIFDYQGIHACFWTSSEYNIYNGYYFNVYDKSTGAGISNTQKNVYFSVRCLKDN